MPSFSLPNITNIDDDFLVTVGKNVIVRYLSVLARKGARPNTQFSKNTYLTLGRLFFQNNEPSFRSTRETAIRAACSTEIVKDFLPVLKDTKVYSHNNPSENTKMVTHWFKAIFLTCYDVYFERLPIDILLEESMYFGTTTAYISILIQSLRISNFKISYTDNVNLDYVFAIGEGQHIEEMEANMDCTIGKLAHSGKDNEILHAELSKINDACNLAIPRNPKASAKLGSSLLEDKKYDEALQHLLHGIKTLSDKQWQATCHFNAGSCYRGKDQNQEAIQQFKTAEKLFTESRDAAKAKAESMTTKGKPKEAKLENDKVTMIEVKIKKCEEQLTILNDLKTEDSAEETEEVMTQGFVGGPSFH